MSDLAPVSVRDRTGPGSQELSAADLGEQADAEHALTPAERRARLFSKVGLFIAPVGIAVLALGIYLYRESLDLANAPVQQRSALDWDKNLQPQIIEHLQISFFATALVLIVAIPVGIALTRPSLRRIAPFVITIANTGQALPGYGLLVLFLIFFGQGQNTAIMALALYALLPVLRNTMVGLHGVDRNVLEAGRGMGMTKAGVLARLELPLAVPVIMAGRADRDDPVHRDGHAGLHHRRRRAGHHDQLGPEAEPGAGAHRRRAAGRRDRADLRLARGRWPSGTSSRAGM